MNKALIGLVALLAGCTIDVDHKLPQDEIKLDINLGAGSSCLTCLPVCDPSTSYCEDVRGRPCAGCKVACIGAARYACEGRRPACENDSPDGVVPVPVVCVEDEHWLAEDGGVAAVP